MSKKILEVNFRYTVSTAELEAGMQALISQVANVPGLTWKIWIINESEQTAGGVYLFEDEEDARSYVEGPVFSQVKSNPLLSEMSVKMFDIMDGPSQSTRGPL